MTVSQYVESLNRRYRSGIATEHTYRGDLQNLLETLAPRLMVTNEATRIKCGAPDFILTTDGGIPVGYIEAKDIGVDLRSKGLAEQFERYRTSLDNLIITDYLDFHFYVEGEFVTSIQIAETRGKSINALSSNFEHFEHLLKNFCAFTGQTVTSSKKLAEMMAAKAKLLSAVIEKAIIEDEEDSLNPETALQSQLSAFKEILIHDIKPKEFSDIYAQTIAYGMFAARLHDKTPETFTRQEAAELIPKTNPFLRKLFQFIAGYDLDVRIAWIVDGLANLFRATDVSSILKNFGKSTRTNDPIIHFYETFLAEYDPVLRKARGVWYTPEPIVNFIVRATDEILQKEFSLPKGLADNGKTKIRLKIPTHDKRYKAGEREHEIEVHKVQILDPATGTGTFLSEVVKHIYRTFSNQQGLWNTYIENHLIPRLNGFELLMASYAMAHLKMDMLLAETQFRPSKEQRFKIYLTNSLEEQHPETGKLFASWLSAEANEANRIKRDAPVMVILGNPPYSVSSRNRSIDSEGNKTWIGQLIDDYKKDLNERKINLDDDYIKFIRFGQYFIDKNGEGILAYISNNSFIDGITHRQMRKVLLESFDNIYVINLHGDAKKKEITQDGTIDENVFDIMQGVSINIFVKHKTSTKSNHAKIFYRSYLGSREFKYETLASNTLSSIEWKSLLPSPPYYFFVPKEFGDKEKYDKGISIKELFPHYNSGIQTKADEITIQFSKEEAENIANDFRTLTVEQLKTKFTKKESSGWNFESAKKSIKNKYQITKITYRPFDDRFTAYTDTSGGFIGRPRAETMKHMIDIDNVSLITCRQQSSFPFQHAFVTKSISDLNSISLQTKEQSYVFPLFIHSKNNSMFGSTNKTPNLDPKAVKQFEKSTGLKFSIDSGSNPDTFNPIELLDFVYCILNHRRYRSTYNELLKIEFPRIPIPKNANTFKKASNLGGMLRAIHLLEEKSLEKIETQYPVDGTNTVTIYRFYDKSIYINETQYIHPVDQPTWDLYIGGYQPAQKWLKDRKGRQLSFDEIARYQMILAALSKTISLMDEIEKINF